MTNYPASLVELFDALCSEAYEDRQLTTGKILTIIDAVIVDKEQNKSVKDLMKKNIWENSEKRMHRLAEWMKWFNDNYEIKSGDSESSKPFYYKDKINASLDNY